MTEKTFSENLHAFFLRLFTTLDIADKRDELKLLSFELTDEAKKLEQKTEELRLFPMQDGPPVTWKTAEMIYELYSAIYPPPNQSLERLGERGGFGWAEVKLLRDKFRKKFGHDAFNRLKKKWVDSYDREAME